MKNIETLKVVALAGGVGGAKMVNGLAQILPAENLFIIGNTADDFEHLGLRISPDLDTVMYNLAGINNTKTGWGLAGETWQTLAALENIGAPTWFSLGDKDLATHLLRTQWIKSGYPLSWITAQLCRRLGVKPTLMPMTDSSVRTILHTDEGQLDFQDYFVRRKQTPVITRIEFEGADTAELNREIITALRMADVIVFAPSNPLLSIDPILALPGLRRMLAASPARKIGISPIIGGTAVKGPAAKIMSELGMEVSAFGVADYLKDVLSEFVLDTVDEIHATRIEDLGLRSLVTNTLMKSPEDQARLAKEILDFGLKT
jgi:LPPG:FO 2-phospho-L-lactate transferase